MGNDWQQLFTQAPPAGSSPSGSGPAGPGGETRSRPVCWKDAWTLEAPAHLASLVECKRFLDLVHIKYGLVKPYCENADYPLVETRELLPSFEADLWEHKKLPGFSLVALARPIQYFSEVFQFDLLKPVAQSLRADVAQNVMARNLGVAQARLSRSLQEHFRYQFQKGDVTDLSLYPALMPFLTSMDRAQVLGMHGPHPQNMNFYLAGVFASLPSDLDTEVKRYGQRIGMFHLDDHDAYERNRAFVFQHLMELYGYPSTASERRTSAALFARRLHKMGEKYLVRTLGQSDRTLTTLWHDGGNRPYPLVEKIALVALDDEQDGTFDRLLAEGYILDEKRRALILRVVYQQHKYSPDNVRQERALSVKWHEIIHPLTGEALRGTNVIRDNTTMFLRLSDIVHGEHTGRIVYKRNEIVENTDTEQKRLKFLFAWLSKHQRRMIGYSDEFFVNIGKVLDSYLLTPDKEERFAGQHELYQEVFSKYSYIQQARKIRMLEELQERTVKGTRVPYVRMLAEAVALLHSLKFEIVSYFDSLVAAAIATGESMLNDRYLIRSYIEKNEAELTRNGLEIKKQYGRLVALVDDLKSIRRTRTEPVSRPASAPASE